MFSGLLRRLAGRGSRAPSVDFMPRWKEELVCTMDRHTFVLEFTMGVCAAYLPTQASWESVAPDWARPHWERIRSALADWCNREGVPLHVEAQAWVRFD